MNDFQQLSEYQIEEGVSFVGKVVSELHVHVSSGEEHGSDWFAWRTAFSTQEEHFGQVAGQVGNQFVFFRFVEQTS